jgi:hypothetical protein
MTLQKITFVTWLASLLNQLVLLFSHLSFCCAKISHCNCFCGVERLKFGMDLSMLQMGGQTQVDHELLYRFVFPERPGALMQFLEMFSPRWNITLFHYRSQGETGANVLVGLQVVKEDEQEFIHCADALGYEYQDERSNEAFQLIMRGY